MRSLLPLCGTLVLSACQPARPPLQAVVLVEEDLQDPAVAKLVREHVAALQARPDDPRAHGELGLVLEANERWSEAAQSFANAAALEPGEPHWRYHRAIALTFLGQSEAARELLLEVARELPGAPYVQQRLGEAELARGEHAQALQHFARTIELAPDRAEGYVGAGATELALGRADDARKSLERAVELDPSYKSAHYRLGLAYRELGRVAEAERELALGLAGGVRFLPDPFRLKLLRFAVSTNARLQRALQLLESGKPERAVKVLETLRQEDPGNVTILNDLAIALQRTGALDAALPWLQEAARIAPEVSSTWINLAALALDQNTTARALECAERALELEPESARAHLTRARVLLRQDRTTEASLELEQGLRLDPREFEALALLGNTRLTLQQYDQARECFATLAEQRPFDPSARVGLAEVALAQGARAAAEQEFAAARALAPDHPEVVALARKLAAR